MKFYYYLYYRLELFYKKRRPDFYKGEAISKFYGIILFNLFSVYLIVYSFDLFSDPFAKTSTGNDLANRGLIFLFISLLFIPFYFFAKRKHKVYNKHFLLFEKESKKEKKKNGLKVMIYIIITVLLMLLVPFLGLV